MTGHLNLPSSDLCTVWYRTRWYLCDLRGVYQYSYPLIAARVQGVVPCNLLGGYSRVSALMIGLPELPLYLRHEKSSPTSGQ